MGLNLFFLVVKIDCLFVFDFLYFEYECILFFFEGLFVFCEVFVLLFLMCFIEIFVIGWEDVVIFVLLLMLFLVLLVFGFFVMLCFIMFFDFLSDLIRWRFFLFKIVFLYWRILFLLNLVFFNWIIFFVFIELLIIDFCLDKLFFSGFFIKVVIFVGR